MPTFQGRAQQAGVPCVAKSMPTVRGFQSGESPVFEYPYSISGTTRDSVGAALGACRVELFRTADDSNVSQTFSDANGIFIMSASNLIQHYLVAYKAGSPDVAGTSLNTLVGV